MRYKKRHLMRVSAKRVMRNIEAAKTGANGYGMVALDSEQIQAYERACRGLGSWQWVWVR